MGYRRVIPATNARSLRAREIASPVPSDAAAPPCQKAPARRPGKPKNPTRQLPSTPAARPSQAGACGSPGDHPPALSSPLPDLLRNSQTSLSNSASRPLLFGSSTAASSLGFLHSTPIAHEACTPSSTPLGAAAKDAGRKLDFRVIDPASRLWRMLTTHEQKAAYWREMCVRKAGANLGLDAPGEGLERVAEERLKLRNFAADVPLQSRCLLKREKDELLRDAAELRRTLECAIERGALAIGKVNLHSIDLLRPRVRLNVRIAVRSVLVDELERPDLAADCLDEIAVLAHERSTVCNMMTSEKSFLAWAEGEYTCEEAGESVPRS